MAEQKAEQDATQWESGTEQKPDNMATEVVRHAQDMTNDVMRHVPQAAGDVAQHAQDLTGEFAQHSRVAADDVIRETPILMGHVWDHIVGWFKVDKDEETK